MKSLNIIKNPLFEESISINNYFNDIKKLKSTSKEEEQEIGKRILEGDSTAIDELVKRNIKLVITIAKQYQGHNIELDDLIAEGNTGLIRAAQDFDYRLGNKFSSYAFRIIRQFIMYAINENSRIIRVPVNKLNDYNKVQYFIEKFQKEKGREPTNKEISENLKVKEKDLISLMDINDHICLENSTENEEENENFSLIDKISQEENEETDATINTKDIRNNLTVILKKELNSKQLQYVQLKFGINCTPETLESICRIMCLSKIKIKQLDKEITDKLKSNNNLKLLFHQL